jgi:glycerol transport system permease protein
MNKKWILPTFYILFLMLPIYGLLSMSFKTTNEILGGFSFFPQQFTLDNYVKIFTDPTWYNGYINSLIYVVINTVISVAVALPAAYAFSRYRFLGDKHLFFWLLTNRMAPPAVFALPFFQLYSAIELFDTHIAVALAHCLFNIPLERVSCRAFPRNSTKPPISTVTLSGAFSCGFLFPLSPPV